MFEQDDVALGRVVDELRKPVRVNPDLDARVMAAIDAEARESSATRVRRWLTEPRVVTVTPLRLLAMAAGIVAFLVIEGDRAPTVRDVTTAAAPALIPASRSADTTVIRFVFVAPKATSVSLVGDFNGWDRAQTPLQPMGGGSMWSVALPLPPGRHRYAFIVDGKKWVVDPSAPRAVEDDFGSPNSVVTVGEHIT